ncbi:rod shape-determining protein MreB [Streptomyces celluloflavus]|uniref:Cell shape-determining protein MreB n=2 Tax=Streptomyces TaxID=1883 RepID=A0A4Q9HRN3_STRKA|nr:MULTISPECIES: rod shape-determining protein [Streptomyces]MYU52199.1 MreB/Mrl family cell shape determining protein [Streptomyces sp. SID7805]TBO57622.1 rod shape-determining protein [Streptomyces kasugaensis]WSK12552.1 rod shape-determining protein [Streptomyces celluloflavus]
MASSTSSGTYDIGIDLGTANTLVYARGKGVVLNEPSVVAVNAAGEVIAVGAEAKRTIGRTPSGITAMRPLKEGVIADFDAAEQMLRALMKKALPSRRFSKPRVVICVPSGITGVERRAVIDSARGAGAREVHLIEEPMAAAIGAGLPVDEPVGCMVVDVGGGTTEVAVVSMGGLVTAQSVRVAGDALDAAISAYVKKKHSLAIGERTAEDIKIAIGSAAPTPIGVDEDGEPDHRASYTIRGRDHVSGLPRIQEITEEEVRDALAEPVEAIVRAVHRTLDECPPELSGDIIEHGISLTGGGALLRGLDRRLREEMGVPVRVADQPLDCVVNGTAKCVDEFASLHGLLTGAKDQPRRTVRL